MANERRIRLIQVAKEFNVGINTITDFLQKKGVKSDGSPMRWSMRRLMPFSKKSSARPCRQQRTCQYPRAHRAEAGDRHPRRRREGQGRKERRGVAGQEQRHQREGRGGEHGSQDIGQDRPLGQRPEGGSGCNAGPGSAPWRRNLAPTPAPGSCGGSRLRPNRSCRRPSRFPSRSRQRRP